MESLNDLLKQYVDLIVNFNKKLRETYSFEGASYDNAGKKFPKKGVINEKE
jgi:hypothetical protein